MRAPRILMVSGKYHPAVGGVERQTQRLTEAMTRRGMAVSVLTGRSPGTVRAERIGGVAVRRVTYLAGWKLGPAKFYVQVAGMFGEMVRRRRDFDVIHAQQAHWSAFAACLAGVYLGKPCIVTFHNAGERFDLRVLREFLPGGGLMGDAILRTMTCATAVSEGIAAEICARGVAPARVVHIPNGIDLPRLDPDKRACERRRLGLPEGGFLVLFVAALQVHKRPLEALAAFAALHANAPAARMIFLGDGPLRETLRRRVAALALGGAVRVAGHVDNVGDYLAAGDVLVQPSDVEGLPLAVLEAMSYGLPCVASAVAGNRELVAPGDTGLLAPRRDPVALAAALRRLQGDEALRRTMGARARALVEEHYRLDGVVDAYVHLYTRLAAGEN